MRSRLSKADFFIQMRKSDRQQELYDNVDNLTLDDIEQCGEPYWIRKALEGIQAKRRAMAFAAGLRAQHIPVAEKTYTVYEWTSPTKTFAPKGHFSIDVDRGNWFYFIDSNMVKVNNFILVLEPGFESILLKNSVVVGTMSSNEYSIKVNTRC